MSGASQLSWYGAKTVYAHDRLAAEQGKPCYEERVVVLQACDSDQAIRLAEDEAKRYAAALDDCRYLGYVNVFGMFDEDLAAGSETNLVARCVHHHAVFRAVRQARRPEG